MNKKILSISILAIFLLVAISFASAVGTNTSDAEKKESPLYGIRTKRAIGEKIGNILENIKTKFLGERMFFLRFDKLSYERPAYGLPFSKQILCTHGMCTILVSSCPMMCPTMPRQN